MCTSVLLFFCVSPLPLWFDNVRRRSHAHFELARKFQDGFVLVGSVAGQRYWSTVLSQDSVITTGTWTPDDQQVQFQEYSFLFLTKLIAFYSFHQLFMVTGLFGHVERIDCRTGRPQRHRRGSNSDGRAVIQQHGSQRHPSAGLELSPIQDGRTDDDDDVGQFFVWQRYCVKRAHRQPTLSSILIAVR